MKDIDGLDEGSDIEDAKCARGISHADFTNASANAAHRLPVVRIKPALHAIELEPGIAARAIRESAKPGNRVAEKHDRFHLPYISSDINRWPLLRQRPPHL